MVECFSTRSYSKHAFFDKASYDRGELTSRDTTKRDKTRDLHFNTLDFDAPRVGGFIQVWLKTEKSSIRFVFQADWLFHITQ